MWTEAYVDAERKSSFDLLKTKRKGTDVETYIKAEYSGAVLAEFIKRSIASSPKEASKWKKFAYTITYLTIDCSRYEKLYRFMAYYDAKGNLLDSVDFEVVEGARKI